MKKKWLPVVLALLLVIPLGLLGLMNTEAGSRWLLHAFFASLAAQVSVQAIEGRILERVTMTKLKYQDPAATVDIDELVFGWQPAQLLNGLLKINALSLKKVSLHIHATEPSTATNNVDINAPLVLPLAIALDSVLVTELTIEEDGQMQALQKFYLSAFTEHGQVKLTALTVHAQPLQAAVTGQIGLGNGFPLGLTADWQYATTDYGLWRAQTVLNGNLQQLLLKSKLSAPFQLTLQGNVKDVVSGSNPLLNLTGNWRHLSWPLVGKSPQISSEQGSFELSGLPKSYQLKLDAQLSSPNLPKAQLVFRGKGSMDDMQVAQLNLSSSAGKINLDGKLSWKRKTTFDLNANGDNFNPAILAPQFPGSLTFSTHIKGQLGENLALSADFNRLSGMLRDYPISGGGKVTLAGERLSVDKLHLNSGKNQLTANGSLGGQESVLSFKIDAPVLNAFWPTLGGSIHGDGQLKGRLSNPAVTVQANGKNLHFAEHSAKRVNLNVNYLGDVKQAAKVLLLADTLKTGTAQIARVQIDGAGTPGQHGLNINIRSADANLDGTLTGSFKNKTWQGVISPLHIQSPDFGLWQLKPELVMRVTKTQTGYESTFTNSCLAQGSATLCAQGQSTANGDLQLQVNAGRLPTDLLQTFLPAHMRLNGLVNATAVLSRQKGVLSGRYHVDTPPKTRIRFAGENDKPELALGALSVSGNLKGTQLTADIDLALLDQDSVNAQFQFDTGKAQTVSGKVHASMANFSLIAPFVPQLSELKGRLKADVAILGNLTKPVITGTLALQQGGFVLAGQGLGLREINLQMLADGGPRHHILLQGSALPLVLSKPDDPKQLQLKAQLNVNADLEQQADRLVGEYHLNMPANATIALKTQAADSELKLGASSLSGSINGQHIKADLNLALLAQDYVNASVQLDMGQAQTLSGQIKSSIIDFSAFAPFLPPLDNIKGQLQTNLALSGRLDQPVVSGNVGLTKGAVDLVDLGLELRDIQLQGLALGNSTQPIQLSGSARSGQGTLNLKGVVDLQGAANLDLSGADFEVAKLPEAQINVTPDLHLAFAQQQGKVTGTLKIPKAHLQVKEFPENAITVSPDEVILGEEAAKAKQQTAVNVDADVEVELGKDIRFSGQGLKTNLSGKLKISKRPEKLAMYGSINMDKARYKSYGQDLNVRKGQFVFSGPVDKPWVNLEAIRLSKSAAVTAILSLTGALDAPQTRIYSEPALPESDALAYLVTGKPLNQVSKAEGNLLASAAISLGGSQVSWIADKLGVDEFEVKEGKTLQDTLMAVGQYLTPDFYIGTKVGLFNKQAVLVLKHKLTNNINLETQAGTSQRAKINYEFDSD